MKIKIYVHLGSFIINDILEVLLIYSMFYLLFIQYFIYLLFIILI